MKKKEWIVNADGIDHKIEYNGRALIVDGEKYKLKSANWFVMLIDYAISFGDTDCRLVVVGKNIDLAVNGIYLGSGQPYEPIASIPVFVSVLAGITCVYGFLMNGWLGLLVGALLASLYFNGYLKKKKSSSVILTFVLGTVLQTVLGIAVAFLLS